MSAEYVYSPSAITCDAMCQVQAAVYQVSVCGLAFGESLNHLWRHPVRSANSGTARRHRLRELHGDAKVRELNLARRAEQQVRGLNVAMYHVQSSVQVLERSKRAGKRGSKRRFNERATVRMHNIDKRAGGA